MAVERVIEIGGVNLAGNPHLRFGCRELAFSRQKVAEN
jgi:hypothetical protein